MATLQKAVVRSLPGEPNMIITLTVGGKQRNMDRPKDELLEKPLGRLQKSAAPQLDKKQQRLKGKPAAAATAANDSAAAPLFVGLHAGPSPAFPVLDATSVTNEEAWADGRLLRVGEQQYRVDLNPPLLDQVVLHGRPFVGIPLVPAVQLHFADEAACQWQWQRQAPGGAWQPLPGATRRRYVPLPEDAGCLLRVQCTPGRHVWATEDAAAAGTGAAGAAGGKQELVVLGAAGWAQCGPVEVPPSPAAAAPRHELTQQATSPPLLRVVTYNILADQYAATETAKNVIFAHCPPQYLDPSYRRPLVLSELLGFNADVMCLQEVDEKMFSACLVPQLGEEGFQGVYTNKAGKAGLSVREGSATFFRTSRFTLAAQADLILKRFFPAEPGDEAKYGSVFAAMLRSSPALQQALQRIATVAQLSLLAPVQAGDRPLCVLNTHLFYHYMAPHIRTMHVWVMLQEAHQFIDQAMADSEVAAQLRGVRPSLLFCGDMNSDLNDGIPGAIELLAKGQLPANFWDWRYGAAFRWEKGEEAGSEDGEQQQQQAADAEAAAAAAAGIEQQQELVAGVDLSSPFQLVAADGLRTPFTNHVKGYQGLLDYIWFDPAAMEVEREVPLQSLEQLGGYLPNQHFPSDHLPVVFDLRFRSADEADSAAQAAAAAAAAAAGNGNGHAAGPAPPSNGGGGGSSSNGGVPGKGGDTTTRLLPAAMHHVGAAVEAAVRGEVLAVPTDTLYGLACCANSSPGVRHIYASKRRGDHKPLAIAVADVEDVQRYGEVQHLPDGLLEELLPGPVTLLLQRRPEAPLAAELNPGVSAIGIRIPAAPFIRAVCRQHRSALALTSANISGGTSSIEVAEFEDLWPACSIVFDGGQLDAGRSGSTIVDLSQPGSFCITRRGAGFARTMQLLQEKYQLRHVLVS